MWVPAHGYSPGGSEVWAPRRFHDRAQWFHPGPGERAGRFRSGQPRDVSDKVDRAVPAEWCQLGVLVLDAVAVQDTEPGTAVVLHENKVTRARSLMVSVHQLSITEALATAELAGHRPQRLTAVGIVPADLDTGYGLSPLTRSRLDLLVSEALHVLAGWGVEAPAHA
ncbi:hydrogenase maturation protease [Streptomyces sp. NPDC050549]|uniref:hydrogenase maturation protease n=1 Tax=Streptomyces sp. NPDC050549 TaxID=3155406 RepID=UPI00344315B7